MLLNIPLVVNNVIQPATQWPGGQGVMTAAATAFGGGTYTLQFRLPDGATFFSTAITAAANGVSAVFTLPQGLIQVALASGPSTAANLNACLIPTNLN